MLAIDHTQNRVSAKKTVNRVYSHDNNQRKLTEAYSPNLFLLQLFGLWLMTDLSVFKNMIKPSLMPPI